MISRIVRHIHASTAIAFAALILSMAGGAFAFGGQGGGSGPKVAPGAALGRPTTAVAVATASKKKSKVKVGPRGPAGPAGKNGTNGAQGPQGEKGPSGSNGTNGANGINGAPGENVTVSTPSGSECNDEGGAKVSNASGSAVACNGKTGYVETLPAGKMEKGTWAFVATEAEGEVHAFVPLSFTIPLPAGAPGSVVIDENHIHFFNEGESTTLGDGCGKGTAESPEAEPGNLCVYTNYAPAFDSADVEIIDPEVSGRPIGAGTTGANLKVGIGSPSSESVRGEGTWAVSAE